MGGVCCRCQPTFEEHDALRNAASAPSMRNPSQRRTMLRQASSSSPQLTSSAPPFQATRHRSMRETNRTLLNYVQFPFPFVKRSDRALSETPTPVDGQASHASGSCGTKALKKSGSYAGFAKRIRSGDYCICTENGTYRPASLVELCLRKVAQNLLEDPDCFITPVEQVFLFGDVECSYFSTEEAPTISFPSELATKLLQWLKSRDALYKPSFQSLAPFLLHEWDLSYLSNLSSSWFDDIPLHVLQQLRSIKVHDCAHFKSFGSEGSRGIYELPSLVVADLHSCEKLDPSVLEVLQFSKQLQVLNLSNCRNVNDACLQAIGQLTNLRTLHLSGCRLITDEGLAYLKDLSKLEKLDISRCSRISDAAFQSFSINFPHLTHLNIAHCHVKEGALKSIDQVSSLESLVVQGCKHIQPEGLLRLSNLTRLQRLDARLCSRVHALPTTWTRLRVLLLAQTHFDEADAAVLTSFPDLEELDVRACRVLRRGLEFISKLTHLKRLVLAETALTDESFSLICDHCTQLEALNISNTEVTDAGMSGVAQLKQLKQLYLDTPYISNRSLSHLSALPCLEELDLFGADVGDNGVFHLVPLKKLKRLEICSGRITDRGIELISKIPTLESLNLSQNRHVHARSLLMLRALTSLKVLNLSNTSISAQSLRHLYPLKNLQTLSIYGCHLTAGQIDLLKGFTKDSSRKRHFHDDDRNMQAKHENALRKLEHESDARLEERVEELKEKMRLLQVDRKSSVEQLESSKQSNKEYIRQLKEENRDLRKQLADVKLTSTNTTVNQASALPFGASVESSEELAALVAQVNKARKQHDEVKHKIQSQTSVLEELKDKVKDLELESQNPSLQDNAETRKIRTLENRLDKAMIKYNEAQSIRKTYEQIVKRLKEERVGFDHQLQAIERAVAAKNHDLEELVLLSSDAVRAREVVVAELEKARGQLEEARRDREKELREKQQYVKIRLENVSKKKKERDVREGDLDGAGEQQLKANLAFNVLERGMATYEKKEHRTKIEIFEDAFRKIKEATGVSDVNEVLQKLTSQSSTSDHLRTLSRENQNKTEKLHEELLRRKKRVEELKYSGMKSACRRKIVEEKEARLHVATSKLERVQLKHERLQKVLVSVKAGVNHLVDKLEYVREDGKVVGDREVTENNLVQWLHMSESTLARLLRQVTITNVNSNGEEMETVGPSRPFNQRIHLPVNGFTTEELDQDDAYGGRRATGLDILLEDPEEALSRERVKRAAAQVLQAQDRKKASSPKKGKMRADEDEDDEETSPRKIKA